MRQDTISIGRKPTLKNERSSPCLLYKTNYSLMEVFQFLKKNPTIQLTNYLTN